MLDTLIGRYSLAGTEDGGSPHLLTSPRFLCFPEAVVCQNNRISPLSSCVFLFTIVVVFLRKEFQAIKVYETGFYPCVARIAKAINFDKNNNNNGKRRVGQSECSKRNE